MTAVFRDITLAWILAIGLGPLSAFGQNGPELEVLHEVTLDIDNDGTADRAALIRDAGSKTVDLYIYLAGGAAKLDLSRKPTLLKKDLADHNILRLEARKNSLKVIYGCGGCSNDYRITLTIMHRSDEFWIAGFTLDWDTRNGLGSCDFNFLTGKGFVTRGLTGREKPFKGPAGPIKLADWSYERRPAACDV
jgi:hypothetical protein